jgi:2-oxoglutarate dehydrogenase complex dehydrogenase (E1) component-like enzyme
MKEKIALITKFSLKKIKNLNKKLSNITSKMKNEDTIKKTYKNRIRLNSTYLKIEIKKSQKINIKMKI